MLHCFRGGEMLAGFLSRKLILGICFRLITLNIMSVV